MNWKDKKGLVTGASGFIGKHLVVKLNELGAKVRSADRNLGETYADLLTSSYCEYVCQDQEIVFNLAGKIGGISLNGARQADMFRENSLIAINMIEAARKAKVNKFVTVSSACIYPRHCGIPTPESAGFIGEPDPSNFGYGSAKRVGETLAKTYADQYGMDVPIVRAYNAYGPGDNFEESGHVIAALIRRCVEGEDPLLVWGSGKPTRSFLYVSDFVDALILAAEKFPSGVPVNVCDGQEVSIAQIAEIVANETGHSGRVVFDTSKPDGQPRRLGDITLARSLGFEPKVNIYEGIKNCVAWYKEHIGASSRA